MRSEPVLWVRAMYGVLLVSILALATLVAGDIVYALQSAEDHADYPILDLAWPVFLITGVLTLVAGVGALVVGRLRSRDDLTRYGAWALGYCVLAVVVVALSEALGSR